MTHEIGTPVIHRDICNDRTGYILAVSEPLNPCYTLGTGKMVPIRNEYEVVWTGEDGPSGISTMSDSTIARFIEDASHLPRIDNVEELAVIAREREEERHQERRVASEEATRQREAFLEDARKRCPSWAKSVIVAEMKQDDCDTMTDYFNSTVSRVLILAFSKHKRNLFPELRKAALNSPETKDLYGAPKDAEHRENWSMGAGNYLKHEWKHRTGWQVSKQDLYQGVESIPSGEWCLPEVKTPTTASTANGSVAIEEHTHTKKGFQMWIVVLADRVERDTFNDLRDAAKSLGGWYSRKWGSTPGGFAFKEQASAEQFATEQFGSDTPPPPNRGEKFRELADKMQSTIDNKLGDRQTNTPKRMREAAYARQEGDRLKRTQEALNALAACHDAGDVPQELANISTKKAVYELMRTRLDNSNCGYYDAPIDTGEPANDSPEAKALWALVGGKSKEEEQAEDLRRKIDALQFTNIPGYFPTPPLIVAAMLDRADIQGGQTVLEPSAGSGAILDALAGLPDIIPGAYETQYSLREILEAKGHALLGHDFMEADETVKFDRIVMNPPFENLQDIDHVMKAFNCLERGGRLVSIMSPGPFFRDTTKSRDFREWFNNLGGEREDLPEGTFKESGTGVASCLIVIDHP